MSPPSHDPLANEGNRAHSDEVPALIVGAGPAGLSAAIALARAGVECLLVERRRELSSLPRATAVSLRSMELMRGWGLEEEIRAGGPEVEWLGLQCMTLASAAEGTAFRLGVPTREQSALASPTAPACVPQDHLEPVLMAHLRSLPAARVELGAEVIGIELAEGGMVASVRDARGQVRSVHADYLIGADGAHSPTRSRLGIEMRGEQKLQDGVSALFRGPLWELLGTHRYGLYSISHPDAFGVFLPAGRGDRWIYGLPIAAGGPEVGDFSEDVFAEQIRIGSGLEFDPGIERMGSFGYVAGLAESFRRGEAFLVGDAAHRVTPRGGTGMNMAIQGGFDLGWKLAWVLRGWAGPELLDTYEGERLPVARHNIERSVDPAGAAADVSVEMHVDLGGRIPHVWTSADGSRTSVLDLLSEGLTLFASAGASIDGWERAALGIEHAPPITARPLDDLAARGLGVRGGAALLVRPDGAPAAWLADCRDRDGALRAATATALAGGRGERRREGAVV